MGSHRLIRRARPVSLLAGLTLTASLALPILQAAPAGASASASNPRGPARGDFNGDGFADLAISIPLASVTFPVQGAVAVVYGSANGLDPAGTPPPQFLTEQAPYGPHEQTAWGLSLAVGDFNGDGFGDLAVGANGADIGPTGGNAGSVTIFSGSTSGLKPAPTAYITDPAGVADDQLAFSLAAGDLNGDGRDDLAAGSLNKTVAGKPGSGAVLLFAGGRPTPSGLDPAHPVQLDESSPHVPGTVRAGDQFGAPLAIGDVNGDGRADLAAGIASREVGGKDSAGAVDVFTGCAGGDSCNGLVSTRGVDFKLNELPGRKSQAGALFGAALAIGDFGRGSAGDLAIGIPGYKLNGVAGAGAVAVLYSSGKAGLSVKNSGFLVEGKGGLPGAPGLNDQFGSVLAAGNLGRSAQADLAIGTPLKTVTDGPAALSVAGEVHVVYGSATGLVTAGSQLFTQGRAGLPGAVTQDGAFGKTMTIGNFAGGPVGQLAVAARDTVDGQVHAGAVTVLPGGPDGIATPVVARYLTATNANIGHPAAAEELFGGAFAQPGLAG